MSLNKCVAMVLLLAYAVPAVLGPGWHTHPVGIEREHSGHVHHVYSAVHAGDEHEHGDHDASEHAHPNAAHDDCGITNTRSELPQAEHQPGSVEITLAGIGGVTDNVEHCVVCAFYSQTYLAVELAELPQSQLLIRDFLLADSASGSCSRQGRFARGPPVL